MILIEKKLIFVLIVAGLLMAQLTPAVTMKSKSSSSRTTPTRSRTSAVEEPEDGCEVTQTFDFVCFFNFLVQAIFDAAGQILAGLGACFPCDKGMGECALCLLNNMPVPPTIPEDCGSLTLQRC